jgi:hypothetical protein
MFNFRSHYTKPFNKINHIQLESIPKLEFETSDNLFKKMSAEKVYRFDLKQQDITNIIVNRKRQYYNPNDYYIINNLQTPKY